MKSSFFILITGAVLALLPSTSTSASASSNQKLDIEKAPKSSSSFLPLTNSTSLFIDAASPSAASILSSLGFNNPKDTVSCKQMTYRREIGDYDHQDLIDFIKALQTVKESGKYNELADLHFESKRMAHNRPAFFPWHRYYIRLLEMMLQQVNPKVSLPYWSWDLDSQDPVKSMVFRPDYFGGNGNTESGNYCLVDGPFKDWQTNGQVCVSRSFDGGNDGGISAFTSSEVISTIINTATSFTDLWRKVEPGPHGSVHNGIGGTMATMNSPNDPLFFLHHAYVDKIWDDYQKRTDFREPQFPNSTEILLPFNIPVRDVLYSASMCVQYVPPYHLKPQDRRGFDVKPSTIAASRSFFFLRDPYVEKLMPATTSLTSLLDTQPLLFFSNDSVSMMSCLGDKSRPDPFNTTTESTIQDFKGSLKVSITTSSSPLSKSRNQSAFDDQPSSQSLSPIIVPLPLSFNPNSKWARLPAPLPAYWIEMNGLDKEAVQESQEYIRNLTVLLNFQALERGATPLNRPLKASGAAANAISRIGMSLLMIISVYLLL